MADIKSCKHCGGISISTAKYCEYCDQPFKEKPLKKREEGYIWARSALDGTLIKVIQYK